MLDGMATTELPLTLHEAPIRGIQPGGGLCVGLEAAWGRLRRALLRRFFPAHVRRMAHVRRGDCPGCPHDIIDARDLKLVRNVCGHYILPEDDVFAWRDHTGLARAGLAEIVCFSLLLAALATPAVLLGAWVSPWWLLPLVVLLPAWGFLIAFFRDPDRTAPPQPDAVVSPADGTVTDIEEVEEPDFPGGRALRVSIFLSVFNVHVNRTPRAARVSRARYFPGAYLDARRGASAARNEQFWIDFTDDQLGCPLRVKQIAGAVARRIVCWLKPGDRVRAGDRLGMIKFGSRTDLLVPLAAVAETLVRVGEAVQGGSTVLLRLQPGPLPPPT
jgi:phosphatidylserine decarboxylase